MIFVIGYDEKFVSSTNVDKIIFDYKIKKKGVENVYVGNNESKVPSTCLKLTLSNLIILYGKPTDIYFFCNNFSEILSEEESLFDINIHICPTKMKEKSIDLRHEVETSISYRGKKFQLLCNFMFSSELVKMWKKMCPCSSTGDDKETYTIIINKTSEKHSPKSSLVYRMEPDTSYNSCWNNWYESKDNYLYFFDLEVYWNNVEWHLSKTYDELLSFHPTKTKLFSTITSNLQLMENHIRRISFIKFFENKYYAEQSFNDFEKKFACIDDAKGNRYPLDIFGKENIGVQNYKGKLPDHEKDLGLFPYAYTFAAENCEMKNYATEKLYDAILSECLCFYSGCPNPPVDERAFIRVDISPQNFESSYQLIIKSINEHERDKRLSIIRGEKERLLKEMSFFPRTYNFIEFSKIKSFVVTLDEKQLGTFIESCPKKVYKNMTRFSEGDKKGTSCHLSLIYKCSQDNVPYMIFEDSVNSFEPNFEDKLSQIYSKFLDDEKVDIILFGWKDGEKKESFSGFYSYIIKPCGAKKVVSLINNFKQENFPTIDRLLIEMNKNINILPTQKLTFSKN